MAPLMGLIEDLAGDRPNLVLQTKLILRRQSGDGRASKTDDPSLPGGILALQWFVANSGKLHSAPPYPYYGYPSLTCYEHGSQPPRDEDEFRRIEERVRSPSVGRPRGWLRRIFG